MGNEQSTADRRGNGSASPSGLDSLSSLQTSLDESMAAKYWGNLIPLPDGKRSDMLPRLVIAVYDILIWTSFASCNPRFPIDAKAVLAPNHFDKVLTYMNIDDCQIDDKTISELGYGFIDKAFTAYYRCFELDFDLVTRMPECGFHNELPLLHRRSLGKYLTKLLLSHPEVFHTFANKVLREFPNMTDPMTEQPFLYKHIPRSCLPAGRDEKVYAAFEKARGQFENICFRLVNGALQSIQDRSWPGVLGEPAVTLLPSMQPSMEPAMQPSVVQMQYEIRQQERLMGLTRAHAQMTHQYGIGLVGGYTTNEFGDREYHDGLCP